MQPARNLSIKKTLKINLFNWFAKWFSGRWRQRPATMAGFRRIWSLFCCGFCSTSPSNKDIRLRGAGPLPTPPPLQYVVHLMWHQISGVQFHKNVHAQQRLVLYPSSLVERCFAAAAAAHAAATPQSSSESSSTSSSSASSSSVAVNLYLS